MLPALTQVRQGTCQPESELTSVRQAESRWPSGSLLHRMPPTRRWRISLPRPGSRREALGADSRSCTGCRQQPRSRPDDLELYEAGLGRRPDAFTFYPGNPAERVDDILEDARNLACRSRAAFSPSGRQ